VPSHGHINPTLGLASELIKQGEEVIYFASDDFKSKIEETGAVYKSYAADLNIFNIQHNKGEIKGKHFEGMYRVIGLAEEVIADIFQQTKDLQFDYLIHSAAFPFTKVISHVLQIPTVSSLAIFAGMRNFVEKMDGPGFKAIPGTEDLLKTYSDVAASIKAAYGVKLPDNIMGLLYNTGDVNLVYTSKYFAPDVDFFDDSYKFVGPPIYQRKEDLDFPFDLLRGRRVIYVSLGTVFSTYDTGIYETFFKSFSTMDAIIVMTAYNVDISQFNIPANFIVRNYVPQSALLKYTSAAVTHAGMNSISDMVANEVPFVALPLGADQPELARRAEELGATISLDIKTLYPNTLRAAVEKVMEDPSYLENIKKINRSFNEAGGYKKAVEEIFKLKRLKGV
jgi:MGT family glycosyltransferase